MPRTLPKCQENVWHRKTITTNVFQLSTDCNYHPLHPKLHLHLNCFRICISHFISHLTTASQLLTDCTSLPLVLIPSWESWSWIWWEYTNSIWQIPFAFLPLMNVINSFPIKNTNANTNVIVCVGLREDDIWLPLVGPSSSQGRSLLATTAAGENGHSWDISIFLW